MRKTVFLPTGPLDGRSRFVLLTLGLVLVIDMGNSALF